MPKTQEPKWHRGATEEELARVRILDGHIARSAKSATKFKRERLIIMRRCNTRVWRDEHSKRKTERKVRR